MALNIGTEKTAQPVQNIILGDGGSGKPIKTVKLGDGKAGTIVWQQERQRSTGFPLVRTMKSDLSFYDSETDKILAFSRPQGLANGDILVALITQAASRDPIHVPNSFVRVAEVQNTQYHSSLLACWRYVNDITVEPSSYDGWVVNGSSPAKGVLFRVTNSRNNPIDVYSADSSELRSVRDFDCPALHTKTSNTAIVTVQAIRQSTTYETDWTLIPDDLIANMGKVSRTPSAALAVSWRPGPSEPAAIGPWTFQSSFGARKIALSFALRGSM